MSQVLLLQCLLVFILPWLASAQASSSSSNDTALFSVFAPDLLPICTTPVISWTAGDAPFTLYMARGNGPIGNDSFLVEKFVYYGDIRGSEAYIDESAQVGQVLRFRVEDNNGVSATAWSLLINKGNCVPGPPSNTTIPDHSTSKDTDFAFTGTNDMVTLTLSIPRDQASTDSPTSTVSSQGNAAISSGTPESDGGTNNVDQAEAGSTGDEESTGAGGMITQVPSLGGGQTSQPMETVAPDNSSGESDTAPRKITLSVQSIGAIIGAVVIAILLWMATLILRWRHRRRPLALKLREIPHNGFMRELLSPASTVPNYTHNPLMAETSILPRNQTQMQLPTSPPATYESPSIPSYGEAIGFHLPPHAPNLPRIAFNSQHLGIQLPPV